MLPLVLTIAGLLLLGRHSLVTASPITTSTDILPRASGLNITSATFQGNGCPKGSVSLVASPDGSALTLGFDQLYVLISPGTTASERSKSCTITMTLSNKSGYHIALLGALYHGSALLDTGMTGTAHSVYTFTPGNVASNTQATVKGPLNGLYTSNATIPIDGSLALCGLDEVKLQINTRISLTSTSSAVSGNIDDDLPLSLTVQQLQLGWLSCV